VHNTEDETYVAERNLDPDSSVEPIIHPLLEEFFIAFDEGRYLTGQRTN
jgi:hemimethylated DNA binding protein